MTTHDKSSSAVSYPKGVRPRVVAPQALEKRARMPKAGRSKYGAVRTLVDGITFDSKAEAARYAVLKLREKAGEIRNLELQPVFPLCVLAAICSEENQEIGCYRGDFRYEKYVGGGSWRCFTEDVKGFKTPLYRWKKKHVEAQYGIQITEIR